MHDRHRPRYHFLPPANWMNDPNGLIQWGETFHLFYQYNPTGAMHRNIHWGHATSTDLLHWQHQPIALTPTAGAPDADGCWSGCAVDDHGTPTLIYTGFCMPEQQQTCLAVSEDGLHTWQKWPQPIIAAPPAGLDVVGFRDHSVWREDDVWHMVIGSGIRGQGGAALLYRSSDLRRWDYGGPLLVGDSCRFDPIWTGTLWECPDFFALQGAHVLICSVWNQRPYYTVAMHGTYHAGRLMPQMIHKLDGGDVHFYAPQTFRDRTGRRIMLAWVMEGRGAASVQAAGWAGVMTLPREVQIAPDGRVVTLPIAEVSRLRRREWQIGCQTLAAGAVQWLPLQGTQLELLVSLAPSLRGSCGLLLRAALDGSEATILRYDRRAAKLTLDRSRSSLARDVWREAHRVSLPLAADELLHLRIFLDASLIEVFANNCCSITSRIYPTRSDSVGIAVFAEDAPAELVAMQVWEMADIWGDDQV